MIEWWQGLFLEKQVFYAFGILSLIALGIQTVLLLVGIGVEHPDVAIGNGEHGSGLGVFSVRSVTAFFLGFGWVGVIFLNRGFSLPVAICGGMVAGTLLMCATYFLMLGLLGLQSSGTLNYQNAVGQIATVYSTVPATRSGAGQIEVMIQGRLTTAEALSASPLPLPPGAKVRVTELIGNSALLVEPLTT